MAKYIGIFSLDDGGGKWEPLTLLQVLPADHKLNFGDEISYLPIMLVSTKSLKEMREMTRKKKLSLTKSGVSSKTLEDYKAQKDAKQPEIRAVDAAWAALAKDKLYGKYAKMGDITKIPEKKLPTAPDYTLKPKLTDSKFDKDIDKIAGILEDTDEKYWPKATDPIVEPDLDNERI